MSNEPKINSLAADFQPDAVEIALRPLPFLARTSVWLGIILFIAAIIWAHFCKVDIIVSGTGKLVSKDQNIVMKPMDKAVISSIDVHVGEEVKKDQILFTFDPTITAAEKERLESEMESIKAQYDRWNAEFTNNEYKYSSDRPTQSERWQMAIFTQRHQYFIERIRYFNESIKRIEANIASTKETVAKQKERFKSLDEINDMYETLSNQGVVARKELLEVRMSHIQLESDIAELDNSIRTAEHERESAIANRETFIMEWQKDVSEQLVRAEQALVDTQKSLDKVLQMSTYIFLRSPCDAIVLQIAPYPVGSSVQEAEPLITLVPTNCAIELEAQIPSKDIGRVKVGDNVRVKLNAYPFQKHGTLDGAVRNISEDSFQAEQRQTDFDRNAGTAYYRTRVTLSGQLRHIKSNFRLIPGMECQAEIKVGTRSVLEYVINPLIKSLDEAIHEP